jgi:hypothetical protein
MYGPILLLKPMFAMVLLTFFVWGAIFFERRSQMIALRIHPQRVATSGQMAQMLPKTNAADNFRNLFELPVLFYTLCILLMLTKQINPLFSTCAWVFVAFRVLHSGIHLSVNRVMLRFYAYLMSSLTLWVMWGGFAYLMLSAK